MIDAGEMYVLYRGAIYEFIRRRVQVFGTTNELAEDLTQETFRKAFEAIQRGVEVEQPSAWLHTIARHLIIDHYREKARRTPCVSWDSVADEEAHDLSPFEQVASDIGCQEIWAAIARLTDVQAETVALQAQGGYHSADLGQATGQTATVAKQRLMRGRVSLRRVLALEGA